MSNNNFNSLVALDAVVSVYDGILDEASWPETTEEPLTLGFSAIGLITDAGEEFSRSVSTNALNAHQMDKYRVLPTSGDLTFSLSAIEHSELVKSLYFGSNKVSGKNYRNIDATSAKTVTVVYDAVDTQAGFQKAQRYVFLATVTPNGAITYVKNDTAVYPLLFTPIGSVRLIDSEEEDS